MPDVAPASVEGDEAERLALELAVDEARKDRRQSVPHDLVRRQLLRDVDVARARVAAAPLACGSCKLGFTVVATATMMQARTKPEPEKPP